MSRWCTLQPWARSTFGIGASGAHLDWPDVWTRGSTSALVGARHGRSLSRALRSARSGAEHAGLALLVSWEHDASLLGTGLEAANGGGRGGPVAKHRPAAGHAGRGNIVALAMPLLRLPTAEAAHDGWQAARGPDLTPRGLLRQLHEFDSKTVRVEEVHGPLAVLAGGGCHNFNFCGF